MNLATSYATKLVALGLLIVLWDASPANKGAGAAPSCFVPVKGGLPDPAPLILMPEKESGYVYPQQTGNIELNAGQRLRLACPGSQLGSSGKSEVIAYCISGTSFTITGLGPREFKTLKCTRYPASTVRRMNGDCRRGELYEIGYDLGAGDFVRILTVCFDRLTARTLVVHEKIRSVIDAAQRAVPAILFMQGRLYGNIGMAHIYMRETQQTTLSKLVGWAKAREYIRLTGNFALTQGQLAAKVDFIYDTQQRATFYYLNTLPMWQSINTGNWQTLEYDVRRLATQRGADLDVWTGGIGVLRLAGPGRILKEFYLFDSNGRKAVPVPKLLFKVIWERRSGKGAVFIVVNNPYLEKLTTDYVICANVCSRISYVRWIPDQSERGLGYCCEVDNFRKVFPDLEAFTTTGLLI